MASPSETKAFAGGLVAELGANRRRLVFALPGLDAVREALEMEPLFIRGYFGEWAGRPFG